MDNDCDGDIDEDEGVGASAVCLAASCEEILNADPTAQDGIYYIQDINGNAIEAYCEMDFDGGGWLAVYNFPLRATVFPMPLRCISLIQNQYDNGCRAFNSFDSGRTSNIDLADYQEVVYGWGPVNDDIIEYGVNTNSNGLAGACYLDGYCGTNVAVGDFYISTTGTIRTIYTGNSPSYPHVGLGFSGQIIVWGYDRNNSSYGHWANWYDGNPCCNAGSTAGINGGVGRYVIYIR